MNVFRDDLNTTPEYLYPIMITVVDNISPLSFLGDSDLELEKVPIYRYVEYPIMTKCGPGKGTLLEELPGDTRNLFYIMLRHEKIGQISVLPINSNRSRVRIDIDKGFEGNPEVVTLVNRLADGIRRIITGQTQQLDAPAQNKSKGKPPGRPHYEDDIWAWKQVYEENREKDEVYDEWIVKQKRNLLDPERQFKKIMHREWL
jgi:hypothetical protein